MDYGSSNERATKGKIMTRIPATNTVFHSVSGLRLLGSALVMSAIIGSGCDGTSSTTDSFAAESLTAGSSTTGSGAGGSERTGATESEGATNESTDGLQSVSSEGDSLGNTVDTSVANAENYCDRFAGQTSSYFCEDFTGTSPVSMAGLIPPMSFRDQTYREYTAGELFELDDPDSAALQANVFDLHTDLVDSSDFSSYAAVTKTVSKNWDITAHSRDGYVQPGTGAGFNDEFWWNENAFMGEHGRRCSPPPDLSQHTSGSEQGERAYTFMQQFFNLPATYNGDEKTLAAYWSPEYEGELSDTAGIHHILRYEDMVYLCADHLMTAAYAQGAAKVSITPDHLLDLSSGSGVVEFSVSTYRTAGRDYWQIDLTPLATHLQLPEGDVVADANGKAVNGFNINTELNDSMAGPRDVAGGVNVFRTMMMKDGRFLDNVAVIDPADPAAVYTRAEITNPGNSDRLALYQQAPQGKDWVITDSSYNQVMYDYLGGDDNPDVTLHNVTDNRSRALFRLTVLKTPTDPEWAANAELWDQVSLCMPEYGNGCIGEYIVPELDNELLVQFTHYAYNTTKSCDSAASQPHGIEGAAFQTTCHPNTYHWDNFYISPSLPFTVTKASQRTMKADGSSGQLIELEFEEPSPPNSKLRFNALTGGVGDGADAQTSLEVSFDEGATWSVPSRQFEPQNSFDKFRSYYTGIGDSAYIPAGVKKVLFKAENANYRGAYWIRDAAFWSFAPGR